VKDFITMRRQKNTALTLFFPITDADGGSVITGATSPVEQISKDGAAFTACTNGVGETAGSGWYALTLTAAEMNYDYIAVTVTVDEAAAWPVRISISTYEDPLETANTELAAIPASTAGIGAMIQALFEDYRHVKTFNKDTGVTSLKKDDGATELGASTSTDDGTTVTRGEMT